MYSTSVCSPSTTTTTLSSLFTDEPAPRHRSVAAVLRHWASEHLSKANPALGRKGAVCPFTSSSIKKDLLRVAYLDGANLGRAEIATALDTVIDEFRSGPEVSVADQILRTALLVLPDLRDTDVIDDVQREFKDLAVAADLMVGQFYPGCPEPGLWNPLFRPLDAPFAMIAVRQMTSSDYPFLAGREHWAAAYLTKFAPDIPARVRNDIAAKISASGMGA